MQVDRVLLDDLYRSRLMALRQKAEGVKLSKSGSVEVLRARLIQHQILDDLDLSWDGIQSMPHKEIGEILKTFGIKSSGSHKERRQRLWLHLNFDSRRMTIERLAELDRERLHEMCQYLELPLTGNRTVLMGRVAGVLTSQANGWGRIKRSLRRGGIPNIDQRTGETPPTDKKIIPIENTDSDEFKEKGKKKIDDVSNAALEDAYDSLLIGFEDADFTTQGDILTIQARVEDLDRMIGTIIRSHEGFWGEKEKDLLLRIAVRRGWPLSNEKVRERLTAVATNIAEIKGADMGVSTGHSLNDSDAMGRVREKLSMVDNMLSDKEN
ncbi:MAG: hypothetical protein OR994_05330 [Candidatus Poseidoniales archaeon]|nr:hypothetical protein [Candidatus Poseidoniales archaeon]